MISNDCSIYKTSCFMTLPDSVYLLQKRDPQLAGTIAVPHRQAFVIVVSLASFERGEVVVHDDHLNNRASRGGGQPTVCDRGNRAATSRFPTCSLLNGGQLMCVRGHVAMNHLPLPADVDLHRVGTRVGLQHRAAVASDGTHEQLGDLGNGIAAAATAAHTSSICGQHPLSLLASRIWSKPLSKSKALSYFEVVSSGSTAWPCFRKCV